MKRQLKSVAKGNTLSGVVFANKARPIPSQSLVQEANNASDRSYILPRIFLELAFSKNLDNMFSI